MRGVQASIAMGQVVGVAKEASLVALRVLDCEGSGTVPDVVAGANPYPLYYAFVRSYGTSGPRLYSSTPHACVICGVLSTGSDMNRHKVMRTKTQTLFGDHYIIVKIILA